VSKAHQFNLVEEAVLLGLLRGALRPRVFVAAAMLKLCRAFGEPLSGSETHWLAHDATPDDLRELARFLEMESDDFNKYRLKALRSYLATPKPTFAEVKKHFVVTSGLQCADSSLRRMLQSMNLPLLASKRGRPKK
jgi:hypothetical protein